MEIRVDAHASFQAMKEDKILEENKIKLIVGNEKNVNKNSVAEKAIQELEDELAKLSPGRNVIGNIILSKAIFALNSRIRHTRRSARELLFRRDQYSGSSIEVDDSKISADQNEKRKKDNVSKENELNSKRSKTKIIDGEYKKGDLVFVITDREKHGKRDIYIIVEVGENTVTVVKSKHGKTSGKSNTVKQENIYKAYPPKEEKNKTKVLTHSPTKSTKFCFYCHRGGYVDYHHSKERCDKYLAVAPKETIEENKADSDTDEDELLEIELTHDDENDEDSFYDVEETEDSNSQLPDRENNDENTTEYEENEREHEENITDDNIVERRRENAEHHQESHSESDRGEDQEVPTETDNLRPPSKPPYIRPIKGDRIIFATAEGFLKEATILTKLGRYGGKWYNVQHDDRTKISVQLTEDSYWKFCQEDRNDFFLWRWGASTQDQ